jgi:hypothetical protein
MTWRAGGLHTPMRSLSMRCGASTSAANLVCAETARFGNDCRRSAERPHDGHRHSATDMVSAEIVKGHNIRGQFPRRREGRSRFVGCAKRSVHFNPFRSACPSEILN